MTTATEKKPVELTEDEQKIWSKCYSVGVNTKAGDRRKRLDVARELAESVARWTLAKVQEWAEDPARCGRREDRVPGLDGCRVTHDWNQGVVVIRAAVAMSKAIAY
jgi:hypothetical protein